MPLWRKAFQNLIRQYWDLGEAKLSPMASTTFRRRWVANGRASSSISFPELEIIIGKAAAGLRICPPMEDPRKRFQMVFTVDSSVCFARQEHPALHCFSRRPADRLCYPRARRGPTHTAPIDAMRKVRCPSLPLILIFVVVYER